ncbi:DUF4479 domain-containing protein [Radiobacillus kanasensis]|uniref:YtpR family tRNA-binding protein n=1 Tax=Radiobacillus kanasensis TaxID=2844358 RepID=UPI001E6370DD|nr:DUF4479 domain-containing protein [Radiobacillus kanasensis]UFT98072.1 DUF4479 domain-containing protein [Radiobacillus kanasensis]
MNMFYNQKGIGDVLIIPVKQGDRNETTFERFGDIVKIIDTNDQSVLGYNVFQASKYFSNLDQLNEVPVEKSVVAELEKAFQANGLEEGSGLDFSPKFVVGYVKEKEQHENADKLSVCQVDVGEATLQIVCGAPNIDAGQKVVVAKVGAIMPSGMEIKPTQLRGVDSHGMICSMKELGLPNAPKEKGIYVLDNQYEAGQAFVF